MSPITAQLILKPKREKSVLNRHPWLFSGAIGRVDGEPQPGDLVQVLASNGRFLATGYFNPHSQIRVRLLSWDVDEQIDEDFWHGRLQQANRHRQRLKLEPATTAYRLVNAEADGLPGLIVDKYDDFLVIQSLTAGVEAHKEIILAALNEIWQPKGIMERSDADVRAKEGLPKISRVASGESPPETLVIQENGIQFGVNLLHGHKSGFYLDQRENRTAVTHPHHVANKTMLNVFAYTGGFGLYAIANGAAQVTHVDSSYDALVLAEQNVGRNGWKRPQDEYLAGDAFDILRHYRDTDQTFDMIVLDPPKFAHSQRDIERACRGYKDLNWLALRLLPPGGLLATFSCSGLISTELFQKVLFGAAVDARRQVQVIQTLTQGPDHPVLLTFPESAYLKGFLCRVW
ncbi:class I SAM-dependent rRNA methyltransferase [Candidatus Leptofilum sp.]|uniref:class I SAM-dependent rRNA methyltransferase n=1 Tax=Candidatus Leptofilum sp. TaxID=3241576 RepID=UPI003B5B6CC3